MSLQLLLILNGIPTMSTCQQRCNDAIQMAYILPHAEMITLVISLFEKKLQSQWLMSLSILKSELLGTDSQSNDLPRINSCCGVTIAEAQVVELQQFYKSKTGKQRSNSLAESHSKTSTMRSTKGAKRC